MVEGLEYRLTVNEDCKIVYLNAHLFNVNDNKTKHFKDFKLDGSTASSIINRIKHYENSGINFLYVIDLDLILEAHHFFKKFKKLFQSKDIEIFFTNVTRNDISTVLCEEIGIDTILQSSYNIKHYSSVSIIEKYGLLLSSICFKKLRRTQLHTHLMKKSLELKSDDRKLEYLNSSNLYTDYYINAKTYFTHPIYYFKVVYELCIEILLSKASFDFIVSPSNNASILATGISRLLGVESVCLHNIGPIQSFNDKMLFERVLADKRYLFIYDFMCLGSEMRRTMFVLSLKNSKLVSAVGISVFKLPFRNPDIKIFDNVHYLFNINELDEYNYNCYFEASDN